MKYSAEQETELLKDILSFAYDPLGFVMYNYPWGVPGSPLEHFRGPRKWQHEVLSDLGEHVREQGRRVHQGLPPATYREVDRSGRGPGKSALFGWLSNWQLSCHLGSCTIVSANTESQLRSKTFPEFSRWFNMGLNAHWFDVDTMKITGRQWIRELLAEQLSVDTGYWYVQGQTWSEENPDAFAGAHNAYGLLVLFDEASGIPEPIWQVTNGFFTELNPFRAWLAFSNPRRNSGAFYSRCCEPEYADTWRRRHVNCRDVEGVDQSVYDAIIAENGADSDTARVEVFGEFPEQDEGQFIAASEVREAQRREQISFPDADPLVMGVDPAPRGRTVIRFRQGRDARSIPPTVLTGRNNYQIVDICVDLINQYNPDGVCVDAGQGTGVIDGLRGKGIRVEEVWFGSSAPKDSIWANVGSHLWSELKKWLAIGFLDGSDTLFRDLTKRGWQWHGGREDSKKVLESKKELQARGVPSPDDADALALTFYGSFPSRSRRVRSPGGQRSGVRVAKGMDYDLFGSVL